MKKYCISVQKNQVYVHCLLLFVASDQKKS